MHLGRIVSLLVDTNLNESNILIGVLSVVIQNVKSLELLGYLEGGAATTWGENPSVICLKMSRYVRLAI